MHSTKVKKSITVKFRVMQYPTFPTHYKPLRTDYFPVAPFSNTSEFYSSRPSCTADILQYLQINWSTDNRLLYPHRIWLQGAYFTWNPYGLPSLCIRHIAVKRHLLQYYSWTLLQRFPRVSLIPSYLLP